jgi:hypothetical protein
MRNITIHLRLPNAQIEHGEYGLSHKQIAGLSFAGFADNPDLIYSIAAQPYGHNLCTTYGLSCYMSEIFHNVRRYAGLGYYYRTDQMDTYFKIEYGLLYYIRTDCPVICQRFFTTFGDMPDLVTITGPTR